MIKFKLVYVPFGKSNMRSTLDFCPRPDMKEKNVPLHKRKPRCCRESMIVDFSKISGEFLKILNSSDSADFCPRPARKETNVLLHKRN